MTVDPAAIRQAFEALPEETRAGLSVDVVVWLRSDDGVDAMWPVTNAARTPDRILASLLADMADARAARANLEAKFAGAERSPAPTSFEAFKP